MYLRRHEIELLGVDDLQLVSYTSDDRRLMTTVLNFLC